MSEFAEALRLVAEIKRLNARATVHLERASGSLGAAMEILDAIAMEAREGPDREG